MRAIIIKDVPGYQTGTSYSMSADLALYLISHGKAKAETPEGQTAALREIEKRLKNLRGPEPVAGIVGMRDFEPEPEIDPGIDEKGPASKSKAKKRKKKK